MRKVLLIFIVWFAAVLLLNKLSLRFIPDRTSYEVPTGINISARATFLPFLNFDGRNYLDIVRGGYFEKNGHDLRVFFPVYPTIIKIFSLGGLLNPVYTGIFISLVSFLGVIFLFNKMFGLKATVLLLAFPTSFFFAAYYTESVFLLFTLLFFFFLKKKDYWTASIFAALASGARIQGMILLPVLLYEIIKQKKAKKYFWTLLIAPLGFVFHLINSGTSILFGQGDWNRQVGPLGPFRALSDSIVHIFQGILPSYDNPFVYPVIVLEFLIFLFVAFLVFKMYRKVETGYFLYSVLSLFVILFGGSLASSPRYLLVVFPVFVYLAKELKGLYYVYLGVSVLLLIFFGSLFLRGYWAA